MILVDPAPAQAVAGASRADGVTIERLADLTGAAAEPAARAIVEVLLDAFEVDAERRRASRARPSPRSGIRGSPTTSSAPTASRRPSPGVRRSRA